jgi:transposase-like protein
MIQPIKQVKWQSLVAGQEESGQSAAAICRAWGLPESLFYYWKKRLREVAKTRFVEVQDAQPRLSPRDFRSAVGATIEVQLSNGRSLIVAPEFDASHLRALLAAEAES